MTAGQSPNPDTVLLKAFSDLMYMTENLKRAWEDGCCDRRVEAAREMVRDMQAQLLAILVRP